MTEFCKGCPLANKASGEINFLLCETTWAGDRVLEVRLADDYGDLSKPIQFANRTNYIDSVMPDEGVDLAMTAVERCEGVASAPKSIVRRALGMDARKICGAVPVDGQNSRGAYGGSIDGGWWEEAW